MTGTLVDVMKIVNAPATLAAVVVVPDQVQFDCPACDVTHMLTRSLDFAEDADGVQRIREPGGFECDCGVLIHADFVITLQPPKP